MIYSYCERGIFDTHTSEQLTEGGFAHEFSYWKNEKNKDN